MARKKYSGDELKTLNFPAKFINETAVSSTRTVGQHRASGGRIFANEYETWSLARAIAWDQATLDNFLALADRRGFALESIPNLREEVRSRAMAHALYFEGIQYEFAQSLSEILAVMRGEGECEGEGEVENTKTQRRR